MGVGDTTVGVSARTHWKSYKVDFVRALKGARRSAGGWAMIGFLFGGRPHCVQLSLVCLEGALIAVIQRKGLRASAGFCEENLHWIKVGGMAGNLNPFRDHPLSFCSVTSLIKTVFRGRVPIS